MTWQWYLAQSTPTPGPVPNTGWFVVVATIVTAVGGGAGLAALLLVASQRRKNVAEAGKSSADGATALTNAAVGLIKPLEERLSRTEADNVTLRSEVQRHERRDVDQEGTIRNLRREVRILRAILKRIRDVVTTPSATADPAGQVLIVRDLVATVDSAATEQGR